MCRRVDVQNTPRSYLHDYERVDRAEGCRRGDDEVASDDGPSMVSHERRPRLIAPSAPSTSSLRQVLANGPWTERNAEFDSELIGDPPAAPRRIFGRHPVNEHAQVRRNLWPSCGTRLPSPESSSKIPLPANERVRTKHDERAAPVKEPRQRHQ